jgi:hypothetical protein
MLTALQTLPPDAEVLALEAGCQDYCDREVDDYLGRREDSQHVQHEYLKGQVLPGGRRYLLLSSTRIPGTMLVQPSCRRARGE